MRILVPPIRMPYRASCYSVISALHRDPILYIQIQYFTDWRNIRIPDSPYSLRSETADIDWTGQYKLTQTPESLKQFINHYYQTPVSKPDSTEPEQWQMAFELRPSPLVLGILPQLKGTDSLPGQYPVQQCKKGFKPDPA